MGTVAPPSVVKGKGKGTVAPPLVAVDPVEVVEAVVHAALADHSPPSSPSELIIDESTPTGSMFEYSMDVESQRTPKRGLEEDEEEFIEETPPSKVHIQDPGEGGGGGDG